MTNCQVSTDLMRYQAEQDAKDRLERAMLSRSDDIIANYREYMSEEHIKAEMHKRGCDREEAIMWISWRITNKEFDELRWD